MWKHIPCNICGEDTISRLGKPKYTPDILQTINLPDEIYVVKCKNCGFYYTDPMPFWEAEVLQQLYKSEYFIPMTKWLERARIKDVQRRLDAIEQYLSAERCCFLEVGCGPGCGLEEAKKRGWSIYAQDASRDSAMEAKKRLRIDVFIGELEEAGYHNDYFDVVYANSVLEHVPQPAKMLREIHRILRPGGVAYIVVPNEDSLASDFQRIYYRTPKLSPLMPPYHIVGFNKRSFSRLCESTGFDVKRLIVHSGTNEWRKYKIQNWTRLAINAAHFLVLPLYFVGQALGKGITIEVILAAHK